MSSFCNNADKTSWYSDYSDDDKGGEKALSFGYFESSTSGFANGITCGSVRERK